MYILGVIVLAAFNVERAVNGGTAWENTGQARVRFEGSQPILRVENWRRASRFYVGVLGSENVDWGSDEFTSVSRDQAAIYLCQGGQGRGGAWVWIGVEDVEDVERLHEECRVSGATIRLPPTNYPGPLRCRSKIPTAMC